MRLDYPDPAGDDVFSVAMAMRETDYDEFIALSTATDRDALARQLAQRYAGRPDVMVAFAGSEPVAVGGLIEARPGVITLLFFATDRLPEIGLEMTYMVQKLLRAAKTAGTHRIEAVSMLGHDEAHRWIRHLGLEPEGPPMRGYGKSGETYQQFAWVSDACSPGA